MLTTQSVRCCQPHQAFSQTLCSSSFLANPKPLNVLLCCCSAGPVGVLDVIDTLSALLSAPGIPQGPVQLSLAGSSVEAGELSGQLAAALSGIAEKNEAAAAEAARQAEEEEEAPAAAKPAIGLFGIGTRKVGQVGECLV
jgi:hypothetical protein